MDAARRCEIVGRNKGDCSLKQPIVIVALDVPSLEQAVEMVDALGPNVKHVKVGMELYYASGPAIIETLLRRDLRIFLDLKLHDIPNTVARTVTVLRGLGVDMLNVHCAGGRKMMEAAAEAAGNTLQVIGVTQLTSTDQAALNEEIGIPGTVEAAAVRYARLAKAAGLSGVVCSPLETAVIKENLGSQFLAVTPGIRPQQADDDQKRVTTPRQAADAGSDFLVIGRPITAAPNPRQALEDILKELEGGQ